MDKNTFKDVAASIPHLQQRQDSLSDQLKDLITVASKLGMYDAADYVRNHLYLDKP